MLLDTKPLAIDREIRHMGPDDEMSSVAITNVTKQLSERDYLLAQKLNEMLAELRAFNQPIPIVLPRISLPAMASEWVGNFLIPRNYTVTIVNAIVSSTPVAGKAMLEVIHSSGTYGQSGSGTGVTKLVTTAGEYSTVGDYMSEGELIFRITSSATQRIAVSASILVLLKLQVSPVQFQAAS